ncbi:MAG: NAD-dependent epimerase/dehydratase family protein [Chthoniobacteraceae bacterium]|jgi:UDP-glucose 4-epimerase
MKILITGGSGFIGSHLVEYFQNKAEIRVLDNLRSGFRENLAGLECEFIAGSILDRETVRGVMRGVDYVFHLAAMISVPESMENPIGCAETNTMGTLIVLEEAARAGVKALSFSSSAAIYGNNPMAPKREGMIPEPASPYAISKLDGEYYCKMFADTGRLATVSLRYFNVFGPRQNPASAYAAAVPIFIDRALRNEPLTIHGDGGQTRDFVSVRDVARANAFFATASPLGGVFNIGRGGAMTIKELAERIVRLTGSRSEIVHGPARAGDVRHSTASVAKLSAAGFEPKEDFDAALAETIAAYKAARERAAREL